MPHDPVIERTTVLEKTTHGGNDRILLSMYEAPATADGGILEDFYKGFDEWAKREVFRELDRHYRGHLFCIIHDAFQGVCLIGYPALMGDGKYMAVNLLTHALDEDRVKNAGGEILERYGLPRGPFELFSFLEARAKYSRLIVPSRKVPG